MHVVIEPFNKKRLNLSVSHVLTRIALIVSWAWIAKHVLGLRAADVSTIVPHDDVVMMVTPETIRAQQQMQARVMRCHAVWTAKRRSGTGWDAALDRSQCIEAPGCTDLHVMCISHGTNPSALLVSHTHPAHVCPATILACKTTRAYEQQQAERSQNTRSTPVNRTVSMWLTNQVKPCSALCVPHACCYTASDNSGCCGVHVLTACDQRRL